MYLMLGKRLPTIQTMRVLEAAVRFGSFTIAADHLALSQGAISQHIITLERRLGRRLFNRTATGVQPTPLAQELALHIRQGVGVLDRAFGLSSTDRLVDSLAGAQQQLVVSVLPSFATRWLIPRLENFQGKHPQTDLEIQATALLATMDGSDGPDVAVRYGPGGWPGLQAEKLMDETIFPVVSPHYNGGNLPRTPADLRNHVLLRCSSQPWEPWLQAAGLEVSEPGRGPKFSEMGLMLDAAIANRGVALARRSLVQSDLANGRLLRLWTDEIVDVHSYYLVWPKDNQKAARSRTFRDWVVQEVKAWECGNGDVGRG